MCTRIPVEYEYLTLEELRGIKAACERALKDKITQSRKDYIAYRSTLVQRVRAVISEDDIKRLNFLRNDWAAREDASFRIELRNNAHSGIRIPII